MLEDLYKKIRESLEIERNRLVKENLKEQVFRVLLEQNPIEVPATLVKQEAKEIHDEMHPGHHNHHQHSESELNSFNEVAKKRVMLRFVIAEYAKRQELKVEKSRVTDRINEIASVYENPQEVMEWLSSEEHRRGVEAQVMEDQVVEKLMENVAVTEKP